MDPQHAFVNGIGAGLSASDGNPWSGNLLVDMGFNVVRESQARLQVSRNILQTEEKLPVMETNSTIVVTPLWQVVNLI